MKLEDIIDAGLLAKMDAVGPEAKAAVVEVIGRYEEDDAWSVAQRLAYIASYIKDEEAVIESARAIGRYEGETARGVALGLADIASNIKDKEAVIESAKVIGRYEGEAARSVAQGLADVANYTKGAVITACELVKISGSGVFDLLTGRDIASIQ